MVHFVYMLAVSECMEITPIIEISKLISKNVKREHQNNVFSLSVTQSCTYSSWNWAISSKEERNREQKRKMKLQTFEERSSFDSERMIFGPTKPVFKIQETPNWCQTKLTPLSNSCQTIQPSICFQCFLFTRSTKHKELSKPYFCIISYPQSLIPLSGVVFIKMNSD